MDFTHCFKHSTGFQGGEGIRNMILDPLCHRFRCRNFNCNVFYPKHGSKTCSLRKIRRIMEYSSCLSSNLIFEGNSDNPLCRTYLATSFFYDLPDVFIVRGVRSHCQGNESLACTDGNGRNVEFPESNDDSSSNSVSNGLVEEVRNLNGQVKTPTVYVLRKLVQKAMGELEVAHLNSRMFEEKVQKISEAAIALKDKATKAWNDVSSTLNVIQDIVNEEYIAKEAVQKATMALSLAEARLQVEVDLVEPLEKGNGSLESYGKSDVQMDVREDNGALLAAQYEIGKCQGKLANCEAELRQVRSKKEDWQKEVERLNKVAENSQMDALKAEEDVANIMLLAEQAVAFEVEAIKRVNDAEIALKRAEKSLSNLTVDRKELTPASVAQGLMESARKQIPKLVVGLLLFGAGVAFYANQAERSAQLLQQPEAITSRIEVSANAKPLIQKIQKFPKRLKKLVAMLPHQEMNEEEASVYDMLWLLLASVIFVPIFQKIPGGSPVLGYLAAGILIGPYGLSIIHHVHGTKAIAEFGVVFLLFNIGLELSVERLSSMKKYVFGLGSAQVLVTSVAVGLVAHFISGQPGPAAIVIGNGLALSSTAVVLQVLQERGESTSRHGRASFSVLLFQDLAVVVLLILIPLISPNSSKGGVGFRAIVEALGLAAVKASVGITAIIAGGRLLLRPIYKQISENQNPEIFSANTLLIILGTSLLTSGAGLSMALGAFLAGLLLAETEFSLQVESDIAPYRGLLLGLFFMTVGMSIDPKLLISNFPVVLGSLGLLIVGKIILVAFVGKLFGISIISAIRVGLLLAPGGEFAFVAFGEAVNQGIMSSQLSSLLFLLVGISMALTPWLAAGGQLIASRFELYDVRSLLPVESETDDLQDHVIICGFGRVGQIIAQLLSELLIPFVALDVRSDMVAMGRALDLPIYFGDAASQEVLHKVGAERASAATITLDTPGATCRTVWALSKYFPNVKTFAQAHDVDHGLILEKAGATAVVPETLEPSLQLVAAVLAQAKLSESEIVSTINEFRSRHLAELTELCQASGCSLGYGFFGVKSKSKTQPLDSSDENHSTEGTLAI
ncbi:K(+) efflux antiporter 2, chloroplastic-like [Hibiscus syriacus]|uniref:K(+) efflux antiporter 2, chloroplastic-like n=1 Tax=Hibiscus syriacus TaxID=106335 RepID=UPI001921ABB1|nr:K(+) efflux antiporter 2, chloroplastic-like [Hibiscus syriacus]